MIISDQGGGKERRHFKEVERGEEGGGKNGLLGILAREFGKNHSYRRAKQKSVPPPGRRR